MGNHVYKWGQPLACALTRNRKEFACNQRVAKFFPRRIMFRCESFGSITGIKLSSAPLPLHPATAFTHDLLPNPRGNTRRGCSAVPKPADALSLPEGGPATSPVSVIVQKSPGSNIQAVGNASSRAQPDAKTTRVRTELQPRERRFFAFLDRHPKNGQGPPRPCHVAPSGLNYNRDPRAYQA